VETATSVTSVVIVGAGLAGFETARALRSQGYQGRLVLLGAEVEPPYDRPPLSKEVLHGTELKIHFDLTSVPDLELRTGQPARRLADGVVVTDGGDWEADAVVVATGSDPIALPGTATLRTIDDARRLREQLYPGARLAIIGAGWIGAEVATAAAAAGCEVTVYEAGPSPFAQALPKVVSERLVPWFATAGVTLRLGERIDDVDALDADLVLSGLGARPATSWLRDSGVQLDPNGAVVVDEFLRADRPGLFAVGDCAAWWSRRYDQRLRVEHWDTALHAPAVVAGSVMGVAAAPYDPVPYFWSDQFGRTLQYAGHAGTADRMVWRGDPESPSWTVGWFDAEVPTRLTALIAVDRPRDLVQARKLMVDEVPIDEGKFADPDVAVKQAVL